MKIIHRLPEKLATVVSKAVVLGVILGSLSACRMVPKRPPIWPDGTPMALE